MEPEPNLAKGAFALRVQADKTLKVRDEARKLDNTEIVELLDTYLEVTTLKTIDRVGKEYPGYVDVPRLVVPGVDEVIFHSLKKTD